ncbi:uncharacterized protein METZ01_LOCUS473877 [marine metagenome]|uniref:Uncharacterized protein n=1 Tax=marine metagenome TaxID=408172 RepID=A0A383BMI6_9ZZZZ
MGRIRAKTDLWAIDYLPEADSGGYY